MGVDKSENYDRSNANPLYEGLCKCLVLTSDQVVLRSCQMGCVVVWLKDEKCRTYLDSLTSDETSSKARKGT